MVSRGSAATSLRHGGICNAHFVANFVLSLAVKIFENRSIFHEVIDMSIVSCFILTQSVLCTSSDFSFDTFDKSGGNFGCHMRSLLAITEVLLVNRDYNNRPTFTCNYRPMSACRLHQILFRVGL